jgi:cbb3-type cytochrome oxidase maturation protein
MSVLFVVVPVVLGVVLVAVIAFAWAARRGQFDDLTTPALRALHDDEPVPGAAADDTASPAPPPAPPSAAPAGGHSSAPESRAR